MFAFGPALLFSCPRLCFAVGVVQATAALKRPFVVRARTIPAPRNWGLALNERAGRLLNPVESTIRLLVPTTRWRAEGKCSARFPDCPAA